MKRIIYFVSFISHSYLLYKLSINKNIITDTYIKLSSKHSTKEDCVIILSYRCECNIFNVKVIG